MTDVFENHTFSSVRKRGAGDVVGNAEFRHCTFDNCVVFPTEDIRIRTTVRNVVCKNCVSIGSSVHTGAFEEVIIDGLRTQSLLQTWCAVFRHVTLCGKVGEIMISTRRVRDPWTTTSEINAFDNANRDYYKSVDWALDISKGEFRECDIRGVPAGLIRRDAETQIVVTREKALEGRWKDLDLSATYWPTSISGMLESGEPDTVLVAPKRSRVFRQLLDGLNLLREAGVAEPD